MTTKADGSPTRKWIAGWTLANSVFLALPLVAFGSGRSRAGFVIFMVGFLGMMVVAGVTLHRRRPLTRYLPLIASTAIVGLWPLYRFVAHRDFRTGGIFLSVTGFCLALVLFGMAHQWVRERGWVVDSPWRRRVTLAITVAMAVNAAALHVGKPLLTWGGIVAMFATMFWPSRRRAVQP